MMSFVDLDGFDTALVILERCIFMVRGFSFETFLKPFSWFLDRDLVVM